MNRENLEIGRLYSCGGEPVYKLEDIGEDWVLVLHYSTVHYICNPEFFKLENFLEEFEEVDDEFMKYTFDELLKYNDWQTLYRMGD